MKTILLIIFLTAGVGGGAFAQQFKLMRNEESYKNLKDSAHRNWYQRTKYAPLNSSGNNFVAFGGEIRYQYFRFTNEDWGDAPKDNDGFILNRLLIHADWHISDRVRLFTQLQSSTSSGRVTAPSPVEQNELDLHQVFLDVTLHKSETQSLIFRGGRQELNYGSSRLVSLREGPNNRQSFDGVKFIYFRQHLKVDAFYTNYVMSRKGIFNDVYFNNAVHFGGAYLTANKIPIIRNVDVYYLGIKKAKTTWNDVTGPELRHSVGSRIWGKAKMWDYDIEGVYQFGDIASNDISAWTLSSNVNYYLKGIDNATSVGLKTEIISGDRHPNDGKIESFNPLFPKGAYFGYAALIGPSNLFDIHPSFDLPLLANKILFSVDDDILWRYSAGDGIYSAGTQKIYGAGPGTNQFIGHQISGALEYSPSPFVYFRFETTWFKSGTYLKSVSEGKNIFYTGLTATFKF